MKSVRKPEKIELKNNEVCPCESGLLYGKCCKKRAFTWSRDSKGNLGRNYPLNEEILDAFKHAEAEYERVLGRKHRHDDRLFINMLSVPGVTIRKKTLSALKAASIRPEVIYAYLKTERMPAHLDLLTPREAEEFEGARAEYRGLKKEGMTDEVLLAFLPFEMLILENLEAVHLVGSYFIERYLNSGAAKRRSKLPENAEFAIGFFLVNFVKSLHSICVLLQNDISYDAAFLVRSLYENYIRVKYLYVWPGKADLLVSGMLESLKKTTKSKNNNPLPIGHLADQLGERDMYDLLYKPACSMTHAQLDTLPYFIDSGKYKYLELDFEMSALLSAHELTLRVYDEVRKHSACQLFLRKDLLHAMKVSVRSLQTGRWHLKEAMGYVPAEGSKAYLKNLLDREPTLGK